MNRLKHFLNKNFNINLLRNFTALSILQISNYILPLLTFPYLAKTLDVEYFGLLAFATAFIAYFSIIIEYGFNLTATKDISVNRDKKEKIIEIYSSIITIKTLLTFTCSAILSILLIAIDDLNQNWLVYALTFGSIIAQSFFPTWFFQGLEKMHYITYINLLAKISITVFIFIIIKEKSDFYKVPALSFIITSLATLLSLLIVKYKFKINYKSQKRHIIFLYLKDGWHIFLSNIFISLYSTTTIVALGLISNNIIVGYYSMAEKAISAFKSLFLPVSQALYPYLVLKSKKSKDATIASIRLVSIYFSLAGLITSCLLFFFSKEIMYIIYGEKASGALLIFKIMSFIPLLVVLDSIFGTFLMIIFDKSKDYSKILLKAGLLNLALICALIPFCSSTGAALAVLVTELYITVSFIFYTRKNNLKLI